jgi:hypothetical protein
MILKQGPFESLQFADGFIAGIEYLAGYLGDVDVTVPEVVGETFSENDGNDWFVNVRVPTELPYGVAEVLEGWDEEEIEIVWKAWQDGGGDPDPDADTFDAWLERRAESKLPPFDKALAGEP